jgi:hypothetical protein
MNPDTYSFGWLVGLLEGEGSFVFHVRNHNGYASYQWTIQVITTDEDTAGRLVAMLHGTKTGPYQPSNPAHSKYWRVQLSRRAEVLDLCIRLMPYMSDRRRAQLQTLLDADTLFPVRPRGPKPTESKVMTYH